MQNQHTRDLISARKSLWGSLSTLYLLACQVRVHVGDLGLCCVCVVSFECWLSPLCWFSTHRILQKLTKSVPHWAIFFNLCTFLHKLFHEMQATSHNIRLNDNPDRSAKSCNKSVCVCWGGGGGGGRRLRWSWVRKHQKWFLCYLCG